MKFASALSAHPDTDKALEEVTASLREELGEGPVDLVCLFATPHHTEGYAGLGAGLRETFGTERLVGCCGAGVLASGREVEDAPAVAVLAGRADGARLDAVHLTQEELEGIEDPGGWHGKLDLAPEDRPSFVLMPDPFSIDAGRLAEGLDGAYPDAVKVGGMASGGTGPRTHALFLGDRIVSDGALVLAVSGAAELRPLVTQGCRPVGDRCVITKGEQNIIRELGGKPALGVIQEIVQGLDGRDRELAGAGLLIGRVVDEGKPEYRRGDFLIRGLTGVDPDSGAVAVSDYVRRGQTVQLQVRDGATADEDFRELLGADAEGFRVRPPAAAFLFSCNGRGRGMYGEEDHDSRVLAEAFPGLPVAGFFCNGEIGPVGSRTFLHGFTSSVGFLVPRT